MQKKSITVHTKRFKNTLKSKPVRLIQYNGDIPKEVINIKFQHTI